MADIAVKTTGQLVDELVTNAFKTAFAIHSRQSTDEFDTRYRLLREAIDIRWSRPIAESIHTHCKSLFTQAARPFDSIGRVAISDSSQAVIELCEISLATWRAQEVVMGDGDDTIVAAAARTAQRCNAHRAAAIRKIDALLGEGEITITTKTYG